MLTTKKNVYTDKTNKISELYKQSNGVMCDTQALCMCDLTRAELTGEKMFPLSMLVSSSLSDAVPFSLKQKRLLSPYSSVMSFSYTCRTSRSY